MKPGVSVLFLAPYPLHRAPSQRFRVELYRPVLDEAGVNYLIRPFMDEDTWKVLYQGGSAPRKAWGILKGYFKRLYTVLFEAPRFDYVFVHREASPLGPPVFEWILARVFRKKLIYDFDDAIWLPNTSQENRIAASVKCFWKVKYICRWSHKVAGGNDFLCAYARQFNDSVVRVPTVVNTDRVHNRVKDHSGHPPVIGWTGSHSTLFYLDSMLPVLHDLEKELDFVFLVIANRDPGLPLKNYRFIAWRESTEIEDLLQMDAGVMPLEPDPWSEGKCGFKLIQYMALGIPAVASPVGVNTKIVDDGINGFIAATPQAWREALGQLISDGELRRKLGGKCRRKIVDEYSLSSQAPVFLSLFAG